MDINISIIFFLVIVIIIYGYQIWKKNIERFYSDESIQNLTSLYNTDNLVVDGLEVTGHTEMNTVNIFHKGSIAAWSGTTAPPGWAICDGTNGTPDLKGKFICGHGSRAIGTTGGEETSTLTLPQMPHGPIVGNNNEDNYHLDLAFRMQKLPETNFLNNFKFQKEPTAQEIQWGQDPFKDRYIYYTGTGKPHENLPPYYVLAYIMKL